MFRRPHVPEAARFHDLYPTCNMSHPWAPLILNLQASDIGERNLLGAVEG
jgi:hypothetical protein